MSDPVTLDNCAREPIHIPGLIQPHGLMFACRGSDLRVAQVSTNVEQWLGIAPTEVIGLPLGGLLARDSAELLLDVVRRGLPREASPMRIASARGQSFDANLHASGADLVIVELENVTGAMPAGPRGFDPRLRASILRMQGANDVRALCHVAAEEVRRVTGFDRVMVYRFDEDWHGEVVAEARRDDLEPFLGLHYPASDIPEQARRLYTINWLRLIADVAYQAVPLHPVFDPVTNAPLDLSHAVLRSVSPIHIEYLRNMGVSASMSVSLVIDGVLAGLIACHHYAGPHLVDAPTRDTAEFLGQSLSWQLRVLEMAHATERRRLANALEAEVVRSLAAHPEVLDALSIPSVLALTDATGAALVLDDAVRKIGDCPSSDQAMDLVRVLVERGEDVVATDRLADFLPGAENWNVAGMIAVQISRELGEYLIWFRPPTERTVDWAGDPRKLVTQSEDVPPRLSPRGSFKLWRETVRGRSQRWMPWHIDAASNLRRVLLGGFRRRSAELRALNEKLLESDRAKDAFIATVSHELRTPLNAITGWTQLLKSGQLSSERGVHALDVIARNAEAQAQIVDDLLDVSRIASGKLSLDIESVDVPSLIDSVLDGASLSINAKGLRLKRILDPDASPVLGDSVRLRQVVSNLVTNAVKFTPKGGSITVVLRRLESDIEITVQDNGPGISPEFLAHIFEPFRQQDAGMNRRSQGLGLGLAIVRKLVELHGGRVTVESEGLDKGSAFRVQIPMAPLKPRITPTQVPVLTPSSAGRALEGLRVLVVEDEEDARDLLAILLRESGAAVVEAENAAVALEKLAVKDFDLLISDIGMPEMDGIAMIKRIRLGPERSRAVPAIALTAYTRAVDRTRAVQAGFQAHVPKPVDAAELLAVVASISGRMPPEPE